MSCSKLLVSIWMVLVVILVPDISIAQTGEIKIVAFGTSFTAGTGTTLGALSNPWDAYPRKLEKLLKAKGEQVSIRNAGVEGHTTRDLMQRLDNDVPEGTQIVIFEPAFGNDKDRGIEKRDTFQNIDTILSRLVQRNIQVLLINHGNNNYTPPPIKNRLTNIASRHGMLYHETVWNSLAPDGHHPSAAAHDTIAERMLPPVMELIGRVKTQTPAPSR